MRTNVVLLAFALVGKLAAQDPFGAGRAADDTVTDTEIALPTTLDSAGIAAAIAFGVRTAREHKPWLYGYHWVTQQGGFFNTSFPYDVQIQGPLARIADTAASLTRLYQPPPSVHAMLGTLRPTLQVLVTPVTGTTLRDWSADPEAVFLQAGGTDTVIRPVRVDTIPFELSNSFGGHRAGRALLAVFLLSSVPRLPFDVLVVGAGGESRDHVKVKDAPKLR